MSIRSLQPAFSAVSVLHQEHTFADTNPTVCLQVSGADVDTFQTILGKDNQILMTANPSLFFSTLKGANSRELGYPKTWKQCSLLLHLINASGDALSDSTRSVLLQGLFSTFKEKVLPKLSSSALSLPNR